MYVYYVVYIYYVYYIYTVYYTLQLAHLGASGTQNVGMRPTIVAVWPDSQDHPSQSVFMCHAGNCDGATCYVCHQKYPRVA